MVELSIVRNAYHSILISSPSSDEMLVAALLYYVAPMSLAHMRMLLPRGSDEQGRPTDERRSIMSMRALIDAGVIVVIESGQKAERAQPMRLGGAWEARPLPLRTPSTKPPSRLEAHAVIRWCRAMIDACRIEATGDTLSMLAWIASSLRGRLTDRKTLPKGKQVPAVLAEIERWSDLSSIREPEEWATLRTWVQSFGETAWLPEVLPFWHEEKTP